MKQLIAFPAKVLEPIRKYLALQEARLAKRRKTLIAEDPFADSSRLDDNASVDTDAAEQFGHARITAMREETEKMLVRIRKALTKIKLSKYGLCEDCGVMIDTDRLAIDPSVQYCLSCQKKRVRD